MKTALFVSLLIPVFAMIMGLRGGGFIWNCVLTLSCAAIALITKRGSMMLPMALALVISVAGDWCMNHKSGKPAMYIIAIALFLMAHVGFIIYAVPRFDGSLRIYACAALLAGALIWYMVSRAMPKITLTPMKIAVAAYAAVSLISLIAAAGLNGTNALETLLYSVGIAMIVASDMMICENDFVGNRSCGEYIMPLYYMCHIFVAASAVAGMI